MLYSCFDQRRGDYTVYEDGVSLPVNADLPVPSLPPDVGGIGVPALEAGRRLPSGAKRKGRSWSAKGIVVRCDGGGLGELDMEAVKKWGPYVVIGGAAILIAWLSLNAGRKLR